MSRLPSLALAACVGGTLLAAAARPSPAQAEDAPPADFDASLRRQETQFRAGEEGKAIEEARARIAQDPKSAEAHYLLGRALAYVERLEDARVQIQTSLDLDPSFARAWRSMAEYHVQKGELEKALREADRAHELAPSGETKVLRARILFAKGDRPGAHKVLIEAIQEDPGDWRTRFQYAMLLFRERLLADAERELRAVLAAEPGLFDPRRALVQILWERGDPANRKKALEECRAGVRAAPKSLRIRKILADLLTEMEEYDAAADVLEGVLALVSAEDRKEVMSDIRRLRREAALPQRPKVPTEDELRKQVDSQDVQERRDALRIYVERNGGNPPNEAYRRVVDPDEVVRRYAARLWIQRAYPDMVYVLDDFLFGPNREPSAVTRYEIVEVLGLVNTYAALPTLLRALGEPDPLAVHAAVEGIAKVTGRCLVEDRDAVPAEADLPSIRLLYARWWDNDPGARFAKNKAAREIAKFKQRDLATYVVDWIVDEDASLRASVLDCIARLTGNGEWRDEDTSTPEARTALKQRLLDAIGEKR